MSVMEETLLIDPIPGCPMFLYAPTRRQPRWHPSVVPPMLAMLCLSGMLLGGCAGPEPRAPLPVGEAPAFSLRGEAPRADRWWTVFEDDELNTRIERALADNYALAAIWERFEQARAFARRAQADLSPQLDGTAGAAVFDGDDVQERTRLSLGLQASYEVDLWGRIQSAAEAERLRATATMADYQTAAISLSAEVALTWYQLVTARLQLQVIESQLDTNQTVLDVLEKRFAVGQSGSADVLRQRQLVEASREQIVIARSIISLLENQLAVLEGRPPQAEASSPTTDRALPTLRGLPNTGLPADLLQRRPDVRSAFLQLEAADQDVAAAVSDQYPRIDLTASLTTAAENPSGLFSNWLASLAGQLVAPLVDGGRRRAEVDRTQAVRREQLANYGQVALVAFREVEDALAQEADQVDRIHSLEAQLRLADSTYRQLRLQYLNGAADFIDVLTALREQQQLERSVLTAQLDRVVFRIALHRALAGDFDTPRDVADAAGDDVTANRTDEGVTGG